MYSLEYKGQKFLIIKNYKTDDITEEPKDWKVLIWDRTRNKSEVKDICTMTVNYKADEVWSYTLKTDDREITTLWSDLPAELYYLTGGK